MHGGVQIRPSRRSVLTIPSRGVVSDVEASFSLYSLYVSFSVFSICLSVSFQWTPLHAVDSGMPALAKPLHPPHRTLRLRQTGAILLTDAHARGITVGWVRQKIKQPSSLDWKYTSYVHTWLVMW